MSDQETTNATEQPPDPLEEEEGEHEETEPETPDGQEVEPSAEALAAPEGKQAGAATPAPVAAAPRTATNAQTVTWKEDTNDFDESTIEIAITLHPRKGRPAEERLVTICIHNHSGPPVTNYYTQGELTEQSPLDRLLWAIAQEIRKFRAELSRRKQERFEREQQAKRSRQKTSPATRAGTPAATPVPSTTPAAPLEQARPLAEGAGTTSTPPATPATGAKEEEGLVQQPLF